MDNSSGVSGAGAVNHSQEPQNTPVEIKIGAFKGSKVVALPPDDIDVKIVIENDDPDISFQIDINDRFVTITTVCNTYIHPSVLPESPQSTTAQAAPDTQTSQDIQTTAMPASSPFINSGEEVKAQENIKKDSDHEDLTDGLTETADSGETNRVQGASTEADANTDINSHNPALDLNGLNSPSFTPVDYIDSAASEDNQARAGINDSQPETVSTAEVRETITTANPDKTPTLTTPTGHAVVPMSTGGSSVEEPHLTGINTPEKPASREVLADNITLDNQTGFTDPSPLADTGPASRPADSDPVVEPQPEGLDSKGPAQAMETEGIESPVVPADPPGLSRGTPEPAEESPVTEASLTEVRTNAKSASPTTSPVSTSSDDQTVATKSSPVVDKAQTNRQTASIVTSPSISNDGEVITKESIEKSSGQAERSHEPTGTADAVGTSRVQDASTQTDVDTIDTGSHNPAPDLSPHTSSPSEPVDSSGSLNSPTTSPASTTSDDQTGVMDTSQTSSPAGVVVMDETPPTPKDPAQLTEASDAGSMGTDLGSTDITMGSTEPAPLGESSVIPPNVTAGSTTKSREAIVSADSAIAPQAGAEKLSAQAMEVPNGVHHGTDAILVDASEGASKSEPSDTSKAKDVTQPVRQSAKKSKRSKRSSDKPQETQQSAVKKKSKSKRKRPDNAHSISGSQQPLKNDTPNKLESEKKGKHRKTEPASGQKETRRKSKEKRSEKGQETSQSQQTVRNDAPSDMESSQTVSGQGKRRRAESLADQDRTKRKRKEKPSPETGLKAEPVVIDVSDVTFETPTPDKDTAKSSITGSEQPPKSSSKTSKRSKSSSEKSEQAEPVSGRKETRRKSKEKRSEESQVKNQDQPTAQNAALKKQQPSQTSQKSNEWRMTAPAMGEDGTKIKEQPSGTHPVQSQDQHPLRDAVSMEQQSSQSSQRPEKRQHSETESNPGEAKRMRSDSNQSPKEPSPGSNASDAQRITEQPQRLSEYPPGELDAEANGIRWVTKENKKVAGEVAIKHGSLGQCIELLTNQAFTQDSSVDSRSSLDLLFDSFEGQSLFTTGDHWQSPAISRRNQALIDDVSVAGNTATFKYNHDDLENKFDAVKAGANDTPVDKKSTLQFIDLFATAIEQERKPTGQETQAQIDKKQERLQALEEIREFVTQLDPDAPDAAALCRLALQLCGRCRERSMVRQQTRPLCGGFATLQAAWGKSPLNMTRLTLRLACDYQAKSDKLAMAYFELPEGIDFSKYDEALADTLLLSTFYDLDRSGSNSKKDMHFSLMLDVAVQSTDKQNPSDSKFIEALEEATRNKAAVKLSLDAKLVSFLEENWTNSKSRKLEQGQSWNIDKDFKLFEGSGRVGHAVIMDSCRTLSNGNIEIKIHSWGMGMRLQMKPETLLSHIRKNETTIHHSSTGDLKEGGLFKSPDQQFIYKSKDNDLVVFNTNSGMTTKCDDYADEWHLKFDQKLAYLNNTGDIVVVDTHNGNQIVLEDYNGGQYKNFNQNLCYQNQEGGLVFFDMRYNGTFTFNDYGGGNDLEIHMIDQVLLYPNSKGELVVCDTDTGSVEVFNDGNYYQSNDGTLYSINENRLCTVSRQHRDTRGPSN